MPDGEAIAARLVPILRAAGELALRTFQKPLRSWTKSDASPVTEADLAVDAFLRERLREVAPPCGWLSEETEDDRLRLSARRLWVVDPIDGTRAYLQGLSDWSISVALVEDGRPVVAGVFAPALGTLYLAHRGGGAVLNGARVWVASDDGDRGVRLAGPRGMIERACALVPQATVVPKVHSLALRLARVASGDIDVAFAGEASRDWDLAAADLLVHEAGGAMTSLEGEVPLYNRQIPVHRPLLAAGRGRHARWIAMAGSRR